MKSLDFWRLCDELTVIEAALLIVGENPSLLSQDIQEMTPETRPADFDAAFSALKHAISGRRLKAAARHWATWRGYISEPVDFEDEAKEGESVAQGDNGRRLIYQMDPAWDRTTIMVEELQRWLISRGVKTGFFFPEERESTLPYLDQQHPHYAPKLAAAIRAWEAISGDSISLRNKSAKQALMIWLRKNAAQFGLTKDDGNPNEQGIEEISKIANWDFKGGAPRTQGE